MEFKIKKTKKPNQKNPHYLYVIEFMEGDGDNYEKVKLKFKTDEKSVLSLKETVLAIECCINAYRNGKGGYSDYHGLPEYDAFFGIDEDEIFECDEYFDMCIASGLKYDEDEGFEDEQMAYDLITKVKIGLLNTDNLKIEHPTGYHCDTTMAIEGASLHYIDEDGNKTKVSIKFNSDEKERVKECENYFG
jgi:hypothetical protein